MVGIVIVSHSAQLAAGVHELVVQMVQDQVPLAIAGGMDDPENPIGTDPMRVLAAIESVYSEDGVVVLMDLGSALLSAEMAIEFLPPEQQLHIHLCPAPLVEGAMAAAVQASLGSPVEQVLQEARQALSVKENQLGVEAGPSPDAEAPEMPVGGAQTIALTIRNRQGLHARPAAKFVRIAGAYDADVHVQKGERRADARSINQVATLGVRGGDTITVSASGSEADAVLQALTNLVADNFGEEDLQPELSQVQTPVSAPTINPENSLVIGPDQWQGLPASPGIAVGPVACYRPQLPSVTYEKVADPPAECRRLRGAIQAARGEIEALMATSTSRLNPEQVSILEAHLLILGDPLLFEALESRIQDEQLNAAAVWQLEMDALTATYQELDDPYMQARAVDIRDITLRVLGQLLAKRSPSLHFTEPVVLVAEELFPSDTAALDADKVMGICTAAGGVTSHSAILARALGIPAVAGLGEIVWQLVDGQTIGLDGTQGIIYPQPSAEIERHLRQHRETWLAERARARAAGQRMAKTRDGHRIEVLANIGRPADVGSALEYGAEGVGLFRTEFLFMERASAPNEEEQLAAYREAAERLGERPLIIRTLDIGGDKPVPYLDQPVEDNPFLGLRGIRYCLQYPQLFRTQLRAILRAGDGRDLRVMFPMIGSLAELRAARALLEEAKGELRATSVPFDADLPVGIMIEVPSAVAIADRLASEADFFSIGTNDLTQYVMAADRGNAGVADLANAFQPAVLRMIAQTAVAARDAGIPLGMCGELAGNPLAAPLLIGLGLDELSMNAPAIPDVKAAIAKLSISEAQKVAQKVLQLDTATEVVHYLEGL